MLESTDVITSHNIFSLSPREGVQAITCSLSDRFLKINATIHAEKPSSRNKKKFNIERKFLPENQEQYDLYALYSRMMKQQQQQLSSPLHPSVSSSARTWP